MILSIYIDQLTLAHWAGKIDPTDAFIIAFIQGLDPQNPKLREFMWKGHFLILRRWLLHACPLLGIEKQALYKRLRKLRELGIIDVLRRTVAGNRTLAYYKLSTTFWKVCNERHAAATAAVEAGKAIVSEDHGSTESHSLLISEPSSLETSYSLVKYSVEQETQRTAPSHSSKGEKTTPAVSATLEGETPKKARKPPLPPELLSELRSAFRDKYDVALSIAPMQRAVEVFTANGADEDLFLAAFQAYLKDPGYRDWLNNAVHPFKTFLSQFATYAVTAKKAAGQQAALNKHVVTCEAHGWKGCETQDGQCPKCKEVTQ